MKQLRALGLPLAVMLLACTTAANAQEPFGGQDSIDYASDLWQALTAAHLVGADRLVSKPYQGQHPHGAVLDTIDSTVTVGSHTGVVIVKNNYGGDNVSIPNVANDPDNYLGAVTVMFRREAGYDPENIDWFWAKYKPDGSLDKNPAGMSLAGRVAKGKPKGCIACHTAAPGGDMVFNHDRYVN